MKGISSVHNYAICSRKTCNMSQFNIFQTFIYLDNSHIYEMIQTITFYCEVNLLKLLSKYIFKKWLNSHVVHIL